MKFLYYIIISIVTIIFGLLFYETGKSKRNELYIKNHVLINNTFEDKDKYDLFISQLFALNNLVYNKEKIGSINFKETITKNDETYNLSLLIDIYQTMPLNHHNKLTYFFHGIVVEFKVNGESELPLNITGHYTDDLGYGQNHTTYVLTNYDFPIFGINNTITNDNLNSLETVVFTFNELYLLELNLEKSLNNNFSYDIKDFDNYPKDLKVFKNNLDDILSPNFNGYIIPNENEVQKLKMLNYDFHIFEGQEQYNHYIYIYMFVYIISASLFLYFTIIKRLFKKKTTSYP